LKKIFLGILVSASKKLADCSSTQERSVRAVNRPMKTSR